MTKTGVGKGKIRGRFLRSILLSIAVPLLLLCGFLVYEMLYIQRQNRQFVQNEIQSNLASDLEHYFGLLDTASYNIYRYYYMLEDLQEDDFVDNLYPRDYLSNIYNIYDSHFAGINAVRGIFLFNRHQEYLSGFLAAWPPTFYHRVSDTYLDELARLYPPGQEVKKQLLLLQDDENYHSPTLKYYYPILFKKEYVGFLEYNLDPRELQQRVESHNLFHNGKFYLTAGDKIIYQTDEKHLGGWFSSLSLQRKNRVSRQLDAYGIRVEYLYEDDINSIAMTAFALFVLALSLVTAVCISFYASRQITSPIILLDQQMRRIKRGHYGAHVDITTGDEIAELGGTFNEMSDMLAHYIQYEVQSKLDYNNEQIRTLQAQISPHFLHNTLQAISTMASADNNADIMTMCKALSNMYRFNMDIDQKLIQVSEEIMHVRNYMLIIGKRYPDFVRFRVQIPPTLRECLIPKLILQPAVENAIEYGFRSRGADTRSNELSIVFEPDDDMGLLMVRVTDNGAGLTAEDAETINDCLARSEPPRDKVRGNSIGLHNVHTRIRLLCGQGYGVQLIPREEGGAMTVYRLPLLKGDRV